MTSKAKEFIKNTLLADAAFGLISGVLCIAAAAPLSQLMGLTDTIYLTVIGFVLVIYAMDLAFVAFKAADKPIFVKLFFAGDIAWIAASIVLIVGFPSLFTVTGMILIDVVALIVAGFAVSKYKGLRMMSAANYQPA